MKNFFLSLILFSTFCFSQNDTIQKINRIDSICLKKTPSKKYNFSIDKKYKLYNGYSSGIGKSDIIFYFDTQVKQKLMKAICNESIKYKNGMIEKRTGNFYYSNDKFIYIKIKVKQITKNDILKDEFNYSFDELSKTKNLKNLLLFDVFPWVKAKNKEIINFYLKD
ncbi:hypothetical protein [Flavobacterium sp. H122]|uniref:hypothetical protein n=1 Tax=Flavobacterium sp. H122 TaxID=2529860 RepID=UPI0010AA2DD6|nr:hypothetical protein [Flavobacterium sp. H122]